MRPPRVFPYPHRIRLRGPWDCEPLARFVHQADGQFKLRRESLPSPCQMKMPCRWNEGGWTDFAGRMRYRRRFGGPPRHDPRERIWLAFAGADAIAEVWLNGQYLGKHEGATEPFEFDITDAIQNHNELVVEVESPADNGGLWGVVTLEVRLS